MIEHEPRFRMYSELTPNGIAGAWACRCGSSGTSKDPEAAYAEHAEVLVLPPSNLEVRRWAEAKGLPVSPRSMPKGLIKAWDRAHPERPYVREEAWHGTGTGYSGHGCKCDRCSAYGTGAERARAGRKRDEAEWVWPD